MPVRIQRQRRKGWKTPPNTVYVGRPTKWGNPFIVSSNPKPPRRDAGISKNAVGDRTTRPVADRAAAVRAYRDVTAKHFTEEDLAELRGKNLMCWCPLDQPCHADVLLELANQPVRRISSRK